MEEYIYALGNYTLLENGLNKQAGSKPCNEKSIFYKDSKYKMSNSELNYQTWNPSILRDHQDKMAAWACETWKSNQIRVKSEKYYP